MSQGRRSSPLPRGWSQTRRRVLERDAGRCYLCGRAADHVDHIVPACEGGTDDESNLAAICSACHARKTSAEANRHNASTLRRRPEPPHPGMLR